MAISEAYANSATIGSTEYSMPNTSTTLAPVNSDIVLQIVLDLANLAAGDQFELKVYEKCNSGGTQRLAHYACFTGAQGAPLYFSPSMIMLHGWDATLKKLTGTDRSIVWSFRTVT